MVSPIQNEFERKLFELGLSYSIQNDDNYIILNQADCANHIDVRLVPSLHFNEQKYGSKNGNDIQAIGLFKFLLSSSFKWPDIFAFAFQNAVKARIEFLIIPTQEFLVRQAKKTPGNVRRQSVELVFWLMEDGFVYETTNISLEAEWYFLSKGVNGRLSDGTGIDYSEYLNSWRRLIVR